MAFCGKCGMQTDDGVKFCPSCGAQMPGSDQQPQGGTEQSGAEQQTQGGAETQSAQQDAPQNDYAAKLQRLNDTADTTAEFDDADIQQNKVMAILAYIIFLIPLLAAKDSRFARFHTNQGLVLFLVGLGTVVVSMIPLIGWVLAPIVSIAVTVLAIIGIINAANGRAKELPIIGKFKVLK